MVLEISTGHIPTRSQLNELRKWVIWFCIHELNKEVIYLGSFVLSYVVVMLRYRFYKFNSLKVWKTQKRSTAFRRIQIMVSCICSVKTALSQIMMCNVSPAFRSVKLHRSVITKHVLSHSFILNVRKLSNMNQTSERLIMAATNCIYPVFCSELHVLRLLPAIIWSYLVAVVYMCVYVYIVITAASLISMYIHLVLNF